MGDSLTRSRAILAASLQGRMLVLGLAMAYWAGVESGSRAGVSPTDDPADLTVWPNQVSRANSDAWLAANHDRIRRLRPRLLVLNFSNRAPRGELDRLLRDAIAAVAEGSRYHGYANPAAPAFLNYEVVRFVDLRDPGASTPNSSKAPRKRSAAAGASGDGSSVAYRAFFSREFADYYGIPDPRVAGRNLTLAELVDQGWAHELWFFAEHVEDYAPLECVEWKPVYGEQFERLGDQQVQAGNGGDPDMPWTGRSLRIGFINASRGIGCFLESLSHSIEGMANSRAIPYFTKYFHEFSGHDLDRRYGLPWSSFYPLWGDDKGIDFPEPSTAVLRDGRRTWRLTNYVAVGGNVHFLPNGRRHYDLDNPQSVLSTIEDWRIGSGPDGRDLARLWTVAAFAAYRLRAPDCMGPWLIYWRQNFPGLDNLQKDQTGQPMKNWWPFLFY